MRRFLRRLTTPLLSTLALTLAGAPARADWQKNYENARAALRAKEYTKAEPLIITALGETSSFKRGDERTLETMELLSDLYRETRQWAAAAEQLEQLLALHGELGTAQGDDAGSLQNKLGIVYHQMRDFPKAEAAYQAALDIKRKKYKDNVTSIAIIVANLGELYRRTKSWDKAEELHVQALADKENELGPASPLLVQSLNNLALVYSETKRYAEAQTLFQRAVEIASKEEGGKSAEYATTLHNLGDLAYAQGKYSEARAYFEKALGVRKEALGANHPAVADTLTNFGNTLFQLDEFESAVTLYDAALTIRRDEYGASDSRTLAVMRFKAMAFDRMNRKDEANALREEVKALEARRKTQ